jgi:hypothetical protein
MRIRRISIGFSEASVSFDGVKLVILLFVLVSLFG